MGSFFSRACCAAGFLLLTALPLAAETPQKSSPAAEQKKPADKKPPAPLQITPNATPQTKAAPNATPAPVIGLPPPQAGPEQRGLLHRPEPFTPAQKATLNRINQVYNGIRGMSGTFTQIEHDGTRSTGKFYIAKPGKVRFQYDPPVPVEIVADGAQVMVRDKKLNTQDLYPLWQTPLRYLLKDKIDLLQDARVVSILQDQDLVSIAIEEDGALAQGKLTLYFASSDYSLKQWSTVDGRGVETDVSVSNVEVNKPIDAKLFVLQ